jgi:hypothetical protein
VLSASFDSPFFRFDQFRQMQMRSLISRAESYDAVFYGALSRNANQVARPVIAIETSEFLGIREVSLRCGCIEFWQQPPPRP